MAIIYTYPVKATPANDDLILISDSADSNKTKQIKVSSLPGGASSGVTQIIAGTNVTIDPVSGVGSVTINSSGGSLTIKDEGVDLTTSASSINFTGVGVTATAVGNDVTVDIPDAYVIEDVQLASAVSKGTALYISGPAHGSGRVTVDIADATDNTKMPVVGLALANYSAGEGKMIVTGVLDNVDTSNTNIPGGTLGKVVYVDNSGVDNNLTGTKPTGPDLIQNVGIITKSGANGAIQVACIGRTNDLPNLNQGSLFIGNASNQATTLSIGGNNTVLKSNGTTATWDDAANFLQPSNTTTPSIKISGANTTDANSGGLGQAFSDAQGVVNLQGLSSTLNSTVMAVAGEDNVANSVGNLMNFFMASHLGPGYTLVGRIEGNRNTGSISFSNASDYRLKKNITSITGSLDKVKALNPVNYNITDIYENPNPVLIEGFLAHELQAQIPNAVTGEKDAVNEDGSIKAQTVDLVRVIPYLVGAIKELTAKVEALEA